ncbi:MAG: M43 family zinc metalloprotease, partial [Salibacteraceae bacterium]
AIAQQEEWCGSDAHLEELLNANPGQRTYFEQKLEEQYARAINGQVKRDGETVVIPTVVHLIYANCDAAISRAQVEDGMRILNEDMQRLNADSVDTRSIFQPHAAATDIEFRLAQFDPQGNPTDGITRTQNSLALNAGQNVKSLINWPANEYFNIWVVDNISNNGPGVILGYAQFPGSGSWGTYGIVIRSDAFGTIGNSSADGRTLTHEVGHCLNLFHTFQGGCGFSCNNSGDRICDTPPAADATYGCTFSTNTCANDASGSSPYTAGTPDMIENYMSYNACQNLFTKDQSDVMLSVFNVHSVLQSLVSEENLEEKGVGGFFAADFETESNILVVDESMVFMDATKYGATEWSWDFGESSFPSTSENQNEEVTLIKEGLRPVTLSATKDGETLTSTKNVFVVSQEGRYLPLEESFENTGSLPSNNWLNNNVDQDDNEFLITSGSAYSGQNAMMLFNDADCQDFTDELISQSLDFSPYDDVTVWFKAAYAQRDANSTDALRISTSTDFGETWQLYWLRGSNNLKSVDGFFGGNWFPQNNDQWDSHSLTFSQSGLMREGVLLKFEFLSKGGNNFYLDDIVISGTYSGELLLSSPDNGSKGLKKDVLIDWKSVGQVSSYEYQVDVVNTFDSELLISGTTNYINEVPVNEDTEMLLEDLDTGTKYFWRVRYDDNGTLSDWSSTWNFTVSEDGLGVSEEKLSNNVKVYPNPNHGNFTVQIDNGKLSEIKVYDLSGRLVMLQSSLNQSKVELFLSSYDKGMYLLHITSEDGSNHTESIMIQ